MSKEVEDFYSRLKDFADRMNKIRSKTISTQEFKKEETQIYETWMAEIRPTTIRLHLIDVAHSNLDALFEALDWWAKQRVTEVASLKEVLRDTTDAFFREIILTLRTVETPEPTETLMKSASFLGLDTNWSISTCALQLQEVAVTLVAEKLKIDLDRENVERIFNVKIPSKDFSFNHKYEAVRTEVKKQFDIDLPFLATQFRRMRVKVLHEGYNPQPEEKDSLVSFTIGLLKKLDDICRKI